MKQIEIQKKPRKILFSHCKMQKMKYNEGKAKSSKEDAV